MQAALVLETYCEPPRNVQQHEESSGQPSVILESSFSKTGVYRKFYKKLKKSLHNISLREETFLCQRQAPVEGKSSEVQRSVEVLTEEMYHVSSFMPRNSWAYF